jgi:3-methyladenine DNA glycosylase AlkD|tara:strand:- start:933 stop:1643 length:711 start_codon:yes stop_codon:yes gene_type:complete
VILLTQSIKKDLRDMADPQKAPQMQRYMKSEMPFHGVQAPIQQKIFNSAFKQFPIRDAEEWQTAILDLWRKAEFREERYAAIALTGVKRYRRFQSTSSVTMYEEMIVDGAWWDYVDALSNRLGELLIDARTPVTKQMYRWARSDDMWKRRVSIICQRKLRQETDTELLFKNIIENMADEEFFIRKAIGWALREYSKTSVQSVTDFIFTHRTELSPLSKKEGLKVLIKKGLVDSVPG